MASSYQIPMIPPQIQRHSNPGSSHHSLEPDIISKRLDRWHPKITLYSLIIVLLGIGLGSAKAWTIWRGETIASITLEWISGVVVLLSLFILSWYDNLNDVPTPLPLLFSYDCMDVFWRFLSIPKPAYRSDKRIYVISSVSYSYHPPITGYRILTSVIVTVFGLSKMVCSYMGLNTAANMIDWVFATVVGTSLYLLGLYEDNTCNVLPFLFTTDYSGTVESAFYIALSLAAYASLAAACISWIFWSMSSMKDITSPFTAGIYISSDPETALKKFSMEGIHNYAIGIVGFYIHIFSILVPIPLLLSLLLFLLLVWNSRLFPRLHRRSLSVYQKLAMWLLSGSHGSHPFRDRALALGVICAKTVGYIMVHLLAIAFWVLCGIVFIGFFIDLVIKFSSWSQSSAWIFTPVLALLNLGWMISLCAYLLFILLKSLVRPMAIYITQ